MQTCTQEECYMQTAAEIRVMLIREKELQRFTAKYQKLEKRP